MFTVHDYRQVGMPALGTLPRAENAWALADALGIRQHACVLPYHQPQQYGEINEDAARDDERDALAGLLDLARAA
jgi:hypothetical protein